MTSLSTDMSRCAGTAMCVSVAPDYFSVDTPDRRVALLRTDVLDIDVEDVGEAVDLCPVAALRLT